MNYYPKNDYKYYYNNLYNKLVLYNEDDLIEDYLDVVTTYLSNHEYDEVFKIIKSIVEAYNDSNRLNLSDDILELINKLGIMLRIIYRKSNDLTKNSILEWINKIERNNYYNNYYLEDIVLSIK